MSLIPNAAAKYPSSSLVKSSSSLLLSNGHSIPKAHNEPAQPQPPLKSQDASKGGNKRKNKPQRTSQVLAHHKSFGFTFQTATGPGDRQPQIVPKPTGEGADLLSSLVSGSQKPLQYANGDDVADTVMQDVEPAAAPLVLESKLASIQDSIKLVRRRTNRRADSQQQRQSRNSSVVSELSNAASELMKSSHTPKQQQQQTLKRHHKLKTCQSCGHRTLTPKKVTINLHHHKDPFYSASALDPQLGDGSPFLMPGYGNEYGQSSNGYRTVSVKPTTAAISAEHVVLCEYCHARFMSHRLICDSDTCHYVPTQQERFSRDCVNCFDGVVTKQ